MAELSEANAKINCPTCRVELDTTGYEPLSIVACPHCGTNLMVPMRVAHFLLLAPIGTGATGTVYQALDLSLNRYVAVKLLKRELAKDKAFVDIFTREARMAAALSHPNVAQVYSFGEEGGWYYLVMEFVGTTSLDDLIEQRKRLSEVETLTYGIQIASALRAAHQRGLIHGDVKPGNVLISADGTAKLVDFGLAKFKDVEHVGPEERSVWGTPYYFAPEKLRGATSDFRSDMYSLGGTLFHCLAGRPPFEAATADAVVDKNLRASGLSVKAFAPDISDTTALLLSRLLRKYPNERYPNYEELIHDLELARNAVLKQIAAAAPPKPRSKRPSVGALLQGIGLVALAVLSIVLVVANWDKIFKRSAPTQKPESPVGTQQPELPIIPIPTTDVHVNFRKGNKSLTLGKFTEAAQSYETAMGELSNNPSDREWAALMQAVAWLLAGNKEKSAAALETYASTEQAVVVPPSITYGTFPRVLGWMLVGKVPASAVEERLASLPPWGRAAFLLVRGVKEYSAGNYEAAAQALRAYRGLEVSGEQPWLFDFQQMAQKLANELSLVVTTLAQAKDLQEKKQFDKAVEELTKCHAKIPTAPGALHRQLQAAKREIEQQAEQYRRSEEQQRIREEQLRQQRERAQLEAERRLLADADNAARAPLAAYDFDGVVKVYEALKGKFTLAEHVAMHTSRLKGAVQLAAFKAQLIADINATPYEKEDLVSRRGVALTGSLSKADGEKLTFTKRYGENIAESEAEWTELTPSQVGRLAEYYLIVTAQKKATDDVAARHLMLAVFYKFHAFPKEAERNAKEAVRLQPALKEQAKEIFGDIFN